MNGNVVAGAICTQCECPERARIPCDTSDLHAPCCAAQQLACVPGPKPRRETRDANAEEATGEKQLLRLERPFQTAVATYNVIQNARGFLTKQVMRCRARLTAPLGRAQPPLSTTPYWSRRRRFEGNELRNPQPSCDRENDFLDGNSVEHRHASRGQLATPARSGGKKRAGGRKS